VASRKRQLSTEFDHGGDQSSPARHDASSFLHLTGSRLRRPSRKCQLYRMIQINAAIRQPNQQPRRHLLIAAHLCQYINFQS
jgi:hypothetical protein